MGANDLDSYSIDALIAGSFPILSKEVVVDTGSLARGAVLGKISVGTVPTTGTVTGTGNGTMTSVAGKRRIKVGTYTAVCIMTIPGSDGGDSALFEVKSPDGKVLGIARTGVAFLSDEIGFTISDGSADWVVGDSIAVVVPAGSGKYVLVDKAAINGSGVADCILAEAVNATAADVTSVGYITGQFSRAALTFAAGNTYADHVDDLLDKDIHLVVTAAA